MKCPECDNPRTGVTVTQKLHEGRTIRRYRRCEDCGHRFHTYESTQSPEDILRARARKHMRQWREENPEEAKRLRQREELRRQARLEAQEKGIPVEQVYEQWNVTDARRKLNGQAR